MQKTQNFSCLFRHYAKHNGLRKDDLVFYFTDELQQDQTPETVHLMPQDEIWVSHRKRVETPKEVENTSDNFTVSLRNMLKLENHSDVVFYVGPNSEKVIGHKAILSARSEYFAAMFSKGMYESTSSIVRINDHDVATFQRALEFIYSNQIQDLENCDAVTIINLIMLANEYILEDLKKLCSQCVAKLLHVDNIGRFMSLCSNYHVVNLRETCLNFVRGHYAELRSNPLFCAEIEQSPELGLLLLEALPIGTSPSSGTFDSISDQSRKRARVDDNVGRTHEIPSQSTSSNMIQNASFGSEF